MTCFCQKCGHQWYSRSADRPIQCPKCQCKNWDDLGKIRNRYFFDQHEIGDEKVYAWPQPADNRSKLYRALKSYELRTHKKFQCLSTPQGLFVRRIS